MFGKKKDDKLARYSDSLGGMTNKQLKLAVWYVAHKKMFADIGVGLLAAVCVILGGYSIYRWAEYGIVGYWEDKQMLADQKRQFPNYAKIQPLYDVQDLQIGATKIFESGKGRYDFVTMVTNPNKRHAATIRFSYSVRGGETEVKEELILPNTKRPIAILGYESKIPPLGGGARLVQESVRWQRVDPHKIFDVAKYMDERLRMTVENVSFTPASRLTGSPTHRIEFDLVNASAFSFWEAPFYIETLSGTTQSGLFFITLERLKAGESRHVDMRSLADSLNVTQIVAYPLLNIFDPGVFMTGAI